MPPPDIVAKMLAGSVLRVAADDIHTHGLSPCVVLVPWCRASRGWHTTAWFDAANTARREHLSSTAAEESSEFGAAAGTRDWNAGYFCDATLRCCDAQGTLE